MHSTHQSKGSLGFGRAFLSEGQVDGPAPSHLALARWLGWTVAGFGIVVLIGWIAGLPMLRGLLPHQVEVKANTAVCFILTGVALALKSGRSRLRGGSHLMVANLCAALATLVGFVTLCEYAFGWNLGIDELFFQDSAGAAYTVHPGRMALPTALDFLLLGMAVLALKADRDYAVVAWLVVPAMALAGLAFFGELYGLPFLVSLGPFTPIAAPTGAAFLLLGAGTLLAGSERLAARWRRSKELIGFIVAVLLLLVMGGAVLRNTRALIENNRQLTRVYEVLGKVTQLLSAMQDVETGSRGYILTGDPHFLEPYRPAPAEVERLGRELRSLRADDFAQQGRLDRLETLTKRKIASAKQQIMLREQGAVAEALASVSLGEGKRLMDAIRQVVAELEEEETRLLRERQARAEAGTLRTLLSLGAGLAAAIGLLLAAFGLLRREITRRTQAETVLRRSEESLAVTLHSIGDAVLATDTEGKITRMNRVAEQLTGWTLDEARGRPIAEIFHILNEETRQPAVIPVDNVLATGEVHGLANHTLLVARDGTERAIADSAAPIRDWNGPVLGVVLVFRDMTVERAAQKALRESEARYRTLFESIDEGFCVVEMIFDAQEKPVDYRFLEISPSFEKQTGLRDALGKRMKELAPQHETHWFETYGRIAVTGEAVRFQNRAEQLHRLFDVYAFRFGEPENRQVAILFRDITENKRAEEELDRFFTLSLDSLCIASSDGYFKRVSPGITDMLGWTVEEFLARPYIDLVHPDDREATLREVERQVVAGEKVLQFENRYRHKNGSWRVLSWRSVPQPGGLMYATARDVTDLKRTEEQIRRLNAELERRAVQLEAANADLLRSRAELKSLFESLPGLYLVLTPDHRIVAASDAHLKATMTRREDILGRDLFEVFPDNPDDPAADGVRNLRASLERVARNKAPDTMAIQKYDVRRPDGTFEEKYWSPINSPVLGSDRQVVYIIHRVEDVTDFVRKKRRPAGGEADLHARLEQMEAEVFQSSQKISAANQRLQATNAELESFSYSVSHDLRAPLRHVQGYVEMLTREAQTQLSDKARRYLQTIADAAREMGELIDDLLAFSRMGRTEMQETAIDLSALVEETRCNLESAVCGRDIRWKVGTLPMVRGDAPMLRQVFVNLLGNAVKYTRPRESAEIEVGCAGEEEGRIVLFVRDNGAGFDMKYADKLFGVFQRLHRADEFEGTGIGLASVRRVISRHGGRIWAEARVNAGATFYFTLAPANPIRP